MKKQTERMNAYRRRHVLELVARGLAIFMLGIWLTQVIPGATHRAYAAPLEDCDLDGFDDATGVKVPWPGYDETHGDTSAGPGSADWWVKQNQGAAGGSGSGSGGSSSGSGGSSTGSGSSSGSGSGKNSGGGSTTGRTKSSGSSGNSRSASPATGDNTKATTDAATKTGPQTTASPASTESSVAASSATSATFSANTSAATESTGGVAEQTTAGSGGAPTENGNLWSALTVGLNGDNDELVAGLSLLGALALAGLISTGVASIRGVHGEA